MSAWEMGDPLIERARMAIEDEAVKRRDSHVFVICGNGITIRNRDGSDSTIHRMRSDDAFLVGLDAIEVNLKALAIRELADAMDADPLFRDPLRLHSDWARDYADRIEAKP